MDDIIVNHLSQVGTHFNKSVRQVQRWVRDGAPRLSDGSFDLVQLKRWLKQRRKGSVGLKNDPAWGYCRGRLGELVAKEVEALLLAGLLDVETGLNTIVTALMMNGETPEDLVKVILLCLQVLAKPLLKQVGVDSSRVSVFSPSKQVRLILE